MSHAIQPPDTLNDCGDDALSIPSQASALSAIANAAVAALAGVAKSLLFHALCLGVVIIAITLWALLSVPGIAWPRVVAATVIAVIIHAAAIPLMLLWSTMRSSAAAICRYRVGAALLAIGFRSVEAAHPNVREWNDYPRLVALLAEGLRTIDADAPATPKHPLAIVRWLTSRIARIITRTAVSIMLRQLELLPAPDGSARYDSMHEWIGSRMDRIIADAIARRATWNIVVILAAQIVLTIANILAARLLPALW